jgi:dihydropyrimidinase
MLDTVIRNGILVFPEGDVRADLAVSDGRIAALLKPGEEAPSREVIDAGGLRVLPGLIDAHMHVQAPFQGVTPQLTFHQQSVCAAFAGVTTFMDFTNTWRGTWVPDALDERVQEMAESMVDYGVHGKFVEAGREYERQVRELADKGCPTFKLFMTYRKEGVMADDMTLIKIFRAAAQNGCMPMVHAEGNAIAETNVDRCIAQNRLTWRDFAASKPVLCEAEAFARAVALAEYAAAPLLVVHTTNGRCLDIARKAQARGQRLLVETCPSYLTLFDTLYDDPENGHLAVCSPPLRTPRERDEIWQGIQDGVITLVGSDDCSFTRREKEAGLLRDASGALVPDFTKVVNGVAGLELRFVLLHTEGVATGRISLNQLVGLCSTNVARASGCWPRKGSLLPGADADIVLFDPDEEWTVSAANQHNGIGYCLHEGYRARGRVKTTILRGRTIMENNEITGSRGQGEYIRRKL